MTKKVHMISHTHWDREWYFTVDDSKVLLSKAFDEIIDALEKNEDFKYYLLDGQTSILEEYLSLKPNKLKQVKNLVGNGKLITGPWNTQPDVFNIHGESIVRNLVYGIRDARKLGKSMMIGYLPDTFGFNAQMPLILNRCGINEAVVRRGYDPDYMGSTELNWTSLDKQTNVLTVVQPYGYSMGHPIRGARFRNLDLNHLDIETFPLLEKVKQLSSSSNVMCTIGGDQVGVDKDFDKFVEEVQNYSKTQDVFIQSSLEEFFKDLKEEKLQYPTYIGEFRYPRYSRVHKTIGSSRYDIKRKNHDAENHILRVSEVINAISKTLGLPFDQENIDRSWKMLFEAHAHDSMGGCNSDLTNMDVLNRCIKAEHTSNALFAQQSKIIAYNIDKGNYDSHFIMLNGSFSDNAAGSKHKIVTDKPTFEIYNSKNEKIEFSIIKQDKIQKPRKVLLTIDGEVEEHVYEYFYVNEIILGNCKISSVGYNTFFIKEIDTAQINDNSSNDNFIENDYYKLSILHGKIIIENKNTQKQVSDFIYFENMADDGDLYDFSPLEFDKPIIINEAKWINTIKTKNYQEINLKYDYALPIEINETRTGRSNEKTNLSINLKCIVDKTGLFKFNININNTLKDHRLRMMFKTDLINPDVFADLPFGFIKREEDTSLYENWRNRFAEYPVDIEPFQNAVELVDDLNTFSIYSKGGKEYQLINNNTIAISLFRSVGSIGKSDLYYRPGRASGREFPAPEGQLLKELTFDLACSFTSTTKDDHSETAKFTEVFLNPLLSYQCQTEKKDIQQLDYFDIYIPEVKCPTDLSLIGNIDKKLQFSSITIEDNNDLLLKVFNVSNNPIDIDKTNLTSTGKSEFANFLGETSKDLSNKVYPHSACAVRFTPNI